MTFFAVVRKAYTNAGRNQNKTYVNVVIDVRERTGTFAELAALAPWNDSEAADFAIELTAGEHNALRSSEARLHDGQANQPKWQQQNTGTGTTKAFGSWADPESSASVWSLDVMVPDDRWIVRVGDGDPATPINHLATLDLDEDQDNGFGAGRYRMNLRLYNPDDTQSSTNVQNSKTLIGGKNMIFDFTSGLTDFGIDTTTPGEIVFPSNHSYRVIGPGGEKFFRASIFGRDLTVEV